MVFDCYFEPYVSTSIKSYALLTVAAFVTRWQSLSKVSKPRKPVLQASSPLSRDQTSPVTSRELVPVKPCSTVIAESETPLHIFNATRLMSLM